MSSQMQTYHLFDFPLLAPLLTIPLLMISPLMIPHVSCFGPLLPLLRIPLTSLLFSLFWYIFFPIENIKRISKKYFNRR